MHDLVYREKPLPREAVTGRRCDARATVMLAELIRGSSAREAMESAGLSQQKEDPVPVVVPVEIDMVTPRGAWALRARDKVTHDQWGPGVVVRVEEADGEDRARVRFSDCGFSIWMRYISFCRRISRTYP